MKIRFMQMVDYWVGVPACLMLSLICRLQLLISGKPQRQTPRKVLFIELSEMGSAILAHSALARACSLVGARTPSAATPGQFDRLHSAGEVGFLIFKSHRESVSLLELIPEDRIHTIENSSFFSLCVSTIKTLCELRATGYDTVIDLELFSRFTAIISYLCGAKRRVGFSNYTEEGLYRGKLLTDPVYYNGMQHISHNFLSLVRALECPPEEIALKEDVSSYQIPLPHRQVSTERRAGLYESLGLPSDRPIVFLNPDPGALELRMWPIDRYIEVVNRLSDSYRDVVFAIVGLQSARQYAEQIRQGAPSSNVFDLSGKTKDLDELLVLLSGGAALITSDSGAAHMAALVRTPLFVFFGPESPVRYAPLHENMKVYFSGLSCSPCYSAQNHRHSACKNNRCMQSISSLKVVSDLSALLDTVTVGERG